MSPLAGITLISSDSRPRYVRDALTVCAAPYGSHFRFRYDVAYVPPELLGAMTTGALAGQRVLIAFRARLGTPEEVLVPVRWATIKASERIADFCVIHFRCEDYPSPDTVWPKSLDALHELCRAERVQHTTDIWQKPVLPFVPAFVETQRLETSPRDAWIDVVKLLTLHPPLSESYLIRVNRPRLARGRLLPFDDHGRYGIAEKQEGALSVDYYCPTFVARSPRLRFVVTEGLRGISPEMEAIESRYDSVPFIFAAGASAAGMIARVDVVLEDPVAGDQLRVGVITRVKRRRTHMAGTAVATAGGSALVALPGLMGDHASLATRGAMAAAGALLLSMTMSRHGR